MSSNSTRCELAAAIRRVNAAFNRCPPSVRPAVDGDAWRDLEAEIDRASAKGDREVALLAIERWESYALGELEAAVDAALPRPYDPLPRRTSSRPASAPAAASLSAPLAGATTSDDDQMKGT